MTPKDWSRLRKTEADADDKVPFTGLHINCILMAIFLLKLTEIMLAFKDKM